MPRQPAKAGQRCKTFGAVMTLAQLFSIAKPITFLFGASLAAAVAASTAHAAGKVAARELGADYAFTGVVYKVSELVLSMSVLVHETATSRPLASATVDLRGNTNESWRRAIDYLYRNALSARLERLKK
jgi:hypothetical protein